MIKVIKDNNIPKKEEIKKMIDEAFNQENKDDLIAEIKYLKDR